MGLKNDNWLLFVFTFVLTTDVVTADKTKVWWGRYTPDVRQTTDVQDPKASKDFRVSSSGNDAGWGEEFRPKDQYSPDNQLTWPEPDFRPFQAHDADVQWPDKSSKMLDSGTTDSCNCDERLGVLEKKTAELQEENSYLTTRLWDITEAVQSLLKEKGSSKLKEQKQIISFSAHAASNIPFLKDADVIVFDDVLVNNGGAYNPRSGIFTVPVSGVYLFTATIVSGFNTTIETMITLNGQEVSRVFSGAFGNRGSGTNSVVLNLREGDDVWVALFYGNGNYVHGKWSSFTGTLIETY